VKDKGGCFFISQFSDARHTVVGDSHGYPNELSGQRFPIFYPERRLADISLVDCIGGKMSKKLFVGLGAVAASVMMVSAALPAQAYIPTLSEVRVLNGPNSDDEVEGLALFSDAETAVITGTGAWVVDVSSNDATEISGLAAASVVVLDDTETFAYVAAGSLVMAKVDVATASVVDTWSDVSVDLNVEQLFMSADGESIFAVGLTGSFPNFLPGVAEIDLSTGAMTQYDAGSAGPPQRQAAYDATSGKIFIPRGSGSTNFVVFDTASNTFTDITWAGAGALGHCDSQNGVMACIVDGPVPYVATVNTSGAVVASLDLTVDSYNLSAITLTPDGTQAYILVADSSGMGSVEAVDLTDMTSLTTLATSLEYPERVSIAEDAGQIWLFGYYAADYNGGYQVMQYADPNSGSDGSGEELANTGADLAISGAVAVIGALALGAGVMTRRVARRQRS
jgi:hypothetical protein